MVLSPRLAEKTRRAKGQLATCGNETKEGIDLRRSLPSPDSAEIELDGGQQDPGDVFMNFQRLCH